MSRQGYAAEVSREVYDAFLKRRVLVRLPLHFVIRDEERVCLFWIELGTGRTFARALSDLEALELAIRHKAPELERHLTGKLGPATLRELRPKDEFRTAHGQRGVIGKPLAPESVVVHLGSGIDVRTSTLPADTTVSVSSEVALRLLRRRSPGRRRVRSCLRKAGAAVAQQQPRNANGTGNGNGSTARAKSQPPAEERQERQERQETAGNRPVHECRCGACKVAVWESQQSEYGPRYHVTVSRIYKDNQGQWKSSSSFGRDEIPLLKRALDLAYDFIIQPQG
jgi:hypothetical protein